MRADVDSEEQPVARMAACATQTGLICDLCWQKEGGEHERGFSPWSGAWRREHKASTWPAHSPSPGLSVLAEMQPGLLDQRRADLKSCTVQPQPSCSPPSCCSSIFPLRSCPPRCSVQFLGGWGLSLSPSVCLQLVSWKCLPLSHPSLSASQPQSLADVGLLPRLSRCSGLSSRKPLSAVGSRG